MNDLIIAPLKKAGANVWIFGSRSRGDHRNVSDVDILYEFPSPISPPSGLLFTIKSDLDESRFPYLLDLVATQDLAESYKAQVLGDRKPL